MQSESKEKRELSGNKPKTKNFADLMRGLFFLVSTASLLVAMFMFIFVWQPIWEAGFKDFHTISQAINNLNETAKPASEAVPVMLQEMTEVRKTMNSMQLTMLDMHGSMQTLEELTPKISEMTSTMGHLDYSVTKQMEQMTYVMERMTYLLDEMEDQLSPAGMMPFNW